MGRTFVEGTIAGPSATKQYNFFVDTGAALMGLPQQEIDALGLQVVANGRRRFITATGVVEMDTYQISGEIRGRGFVTMVAPSPIPLVGYEMLQTMRLKVNPLTEELEDVPDEDMGPPYFLTSMAGTGWLPLP